MCWDCSGEIWIVTIVSVTGIKCLKTFFYRLVLVDRLYESFQVFVSMILSLTSQISVDSMVRQQAVLTDWSSVL